MDQYSEQHMHDARDAINSALFALERFEYVTPRGNMLISQGIAVIEAKARLQSAKAFLEWAFA